jgi:hypothetical protein
VNERFEFQEVGFVSPLSKSEVSRFAQDIVIGMRETIDLRTGYDNHVSLPLQEEHISPELKFDSNGLHSQKDPRSMGRCQIPHI